MKSKANSSHARVAGANENDSEIIKVKYSDRTWLVVIDRYRNFLKSNARFRKLKETIACMWTISAIGQC